MMLDSKLFSLWRQMGGRFDLEDQPPGGLGGAKVSTVIQPVSDVDQLVRVYELKQLTFTSAAASWVSMFTLPANERWTILRYNIVDAGAGDRSMIRVRIEQGGLDCPFPSFTATTNFSSPDDSQPFTIERGAELAVQFDASGSTDGDYNFKALVAVDQIGE